MNSFNLPCVLCYEFKSYKLEKSDAFKSLNFLFKIEEQYQKRNYLQTNLSQLKHQNMNTTEQVKWSHAKRKRLYK